MTRNLARITSPLGSVPLQPAALDGCASGRAAEAPAGNSWAWLSRRRPTNAPHADVPTADRARSPKLARLEAALFVADGALSARKLAQMATLADAKEAFALISELNEHYDADHSVFRIERVATGFQLLTRPQLAPWLDRVHHRQAHLKLSAPAMETLAIIAYRQPCTRADVEAIRGVQAAEMIKQLMERHLVRIAGEDDSLGRPYLYGTTRLFLETFGLTNLNGLPLADALRPAASESTETMTEPDAGSTAADAPERGESSDQTQSAA